MTTKQMEDKLINVTIFTMVINIMLILIYVYIINHKDEQVVKQKISMCEEPSILYQTNIKQDNKYVANDYVTKVQKALIDYKGPSIKKTSKRVLFSKETIKKQVVAHKTVSAKIYTKDKVGNGNKKITFNKLQKDSSINYETLYDVSYDNKRRTVTYYRKDYMLQEVGGKVSYEVKTYTYTINSKATIAERKNNPGNLTCANGVRSKAYAVLRRNAKDNGDAKSCIYASVELGMKDYISLLHSKQYNNAPIYIAFKKYQTDIKSFRNKLVSLRKAGINASKRFNDLSHKKQLVFAAIYSRYEGYKGLNNRKVINSKVMVQKGIVDNDSKKLNSVLIASKRQVILSST